MIKYSVIFLGTTDFSTTILESLWKRPEIDLKLVITQPDNELLGAKKRQEGPVKAWAKTHQIGLQQPKRLKTITPLIAAIKPDFLITAAYGQIVPQEILNLAQIEALNVHGSLLPKYRGGSPIQTAIWRGEKKSGVTVMRMVKQMDAGPIFGQATIEIDSNLTGGELMSEAAKLGAELLSKLIIPIAQGEVEPIVQDLKSVSFAYNIQSHQEEIDWHHSAWEVHNQIRALAPIPGAFTWFKGQRIKFFKTTVQNSDVSKTVPGTVTRINKASFSVQTGKGLLEVWEVQQAGKKRIEAGRFAMNHLKQGDVLGEKN